MSDTSNPQLVLAQIKHYWSNQGITISEGLAQWFSLIPGLGGFKYVMLEGSLDNEWHDLLQHPQYPEFCFKVLKIYLEHNSYPKGEESDIIYTIRLIEKAYGPKLDPSLREWRKDFFNGIYGVCCVV